MYRIIRMRIRYTDINYEEIKCSRQIDIYILFLLIKLTNSYTNFIPPVAETGTP